MHYNSAMTTEAAPPYTDEQWYLMCDLHMSSPVPLHEADLFQSWVYYRPWGIIYVPSGHHQAAMATLYTFHHGGLRYVAYAEELALPGYRAQETLADRFLTQLEGTAFRSSVSPVIIAGTLDSRERQAFRSFNIDYLGD